ncbi:LacI family DNA-binding transcriptional regulator [Seohaeicola saemankumensis]|uniref:LacI family DNA-binding transcriptional regulator n=1 Tax=Seohaeicola saemankumensis TaxID=481181 RepID=A0ABW3THY1_9RHOB
MNKEKSPRKPTLFEVAAHAGVSEITASRALRGSNVVTPETLQKVQEAATSLGYLRNRLAGALAGGPSNQVGVILPSLSNIVFPDVLKGLEDRLEHAGFHPVLGISNYDPEQEEQLIRNLLSWRPAGLVIAPSGMTENSRTMLAGADLPVVEIMDIDTDPIDMAVGMSHRGAGLAMARHLIARGYRRFAYVGHDIARDNRATARLDGFTAGLNEAGLKMVGCVTLVEPSSVALGRRGLNMLLGSDCARPDLVYFSNDDMAVGGVFHCMAVGISLPDQLAIAGFNGLDIGQSLPTPLTTTASHRARIGETAAACVLKRLSGEETPRMTDVGFTLIAGGTS